MATRTISNAGGNYNTTGAWVEGIVPTSADDVVATVTSGNLTINVASNCKSINFTNYTNTLTATSTLTVSGSVTLVSAMTISGTGTLIVDSTSTLTSNGKTWTGSLTFQNTVTHTLADAWIVSGNLLVGIAAQGPTINGFSISVGGSLSSTSVGSAFGTANVILNGTGTWSWSSGWCFFPITINTVGTITISNVSIGANFVHVAGIVVTTGSTLRLSAATYSITSNTIIWNNVILGTTTSFTTTLNDDLNINGNLTIGANFNTQTVNGNNINLSGSLSSSAGTTNLTGTTVLNFVGTGTWSGTSTIKSNVNINTAGTLTISGTVTYDTRTLKRIAGTVVTTGSTLNITNTATLDTNGITWNNVTLAAGTQTLNSLLTVNGTLSLGTVFNVTFAGTSGFTCANLSCVAAGRLITFQAAQTYTITNSLIITGTIPSKVSLTSTSTGALFNLQYGATQNVQNCNATFINSSGGQTIYTSAGTLSNTVNWSVGSGNFFLLF